MYVQWNEIARFQCGFVEPGRSLAAFWIFVLSEEICECQGKVGGPSATGRTKFDEIFSGQHAQFAQVPMEDIPQRLRHVVLGQLGPPLLLVKKDEGERLSQLLDLPEYDVSLDHARWQSSVSV